jgi:AcrR family transcriptional regulator
MTEADTSDLIWLRPEPSERRPRFSRDQITATAVRIADAEGFGAVTMKRIATELGAGTMSLYYYVRTKADVVALMQDAILADLLIPNDELPSQWREAVTVIARRTRDVLLAHPWSIVSLDDAQFGPNAMRHIEQSLAALDQLDLDPAAKLSLWGIVDDYVFGSALHTIETRTRTAQAQRNPQLLADALTFGQQQLATGQFPRLAALYHQQVESGPAASHDRDSARRPTTPDQLAAQFEHGLTALLDGLGCAGTPGDTPHPARDQPPSASD